MAKKKNLTEEQEKSENKEGNDFETFPKTPIVLMWQNMVTESLNNYLSSINGELTDAQQRHINSMEERIKRAPYDLRNCKPLNVKQRNSFFDSKKTKI